MLTGGCLCGVVRYQIGDCGSPLPARATGTDFVTVPGGTLDDDPGSRPARHIFVGSKAPWFELTDALPRFEEHAPPFEAAR